MTSPSVESLQAINNQNVLKMHVGAALIADINAPLLGDIFDPTTGLLNALPSGYVSCGLTDTGGISTTRSITVDEVMSWQSVEVQRADVSADKLQVAVKFQESNHATLSIQEGVTLANGPASGGKSWQVDKNTTGVQPYRRLLLLGHDETQNVTVARFLPRVMLTALGAQAWQRATEIQIDSTFDCFVDQGLGTSSRYAIGGAGWANLGAITLAVSPSTETLSLAGVNTQQLSVFANGVDVTSSATFVSATPATATVSSGGLVTAVAAGSSVITATYLTYTGTSTVTVAA